MDKPVFVDASGRRLTALRVVGRAAGGLFAGYLVLVGVSLVAPPGLDKLEVPGVGDVIPAQRAPEVVTSDGDEAKASDAVDQAKRAGAAPVTGGSNGASGGTSGGGPAVAPRPTPRPARSPAPTSTPTKGRPTAPPGQATPVPGATPAPKPGKSTGKPTTKPQSNKPTAKPTNGRQNVQTTAAPAPDGGTP